MKNQKFGLCKPQHSEVTLKRVIKNWAEERKYEGVVFSKEEIAKIVQEHIEVMSHEEACNWVGCEREAK
jgi:hypothetical protein